MAQATEQTAAEERRNAWDVTGFSGGDFFRLVLISRDGPKTKAETLEYVERRWPLWFAVEIE